MAKVKQWRLTNGDFEIELCETCRQPIYSGHVDCNCPTNHPDKCAQPTYEVLFEAHDGLVAAVQRASDIEHSVTQKLERELREGYRELLDAAIGPWRTGGTG